MSMTKGRNRRLGWLVVVAVIVFAAGWVTQRTPPRPRDLPGWAIYDRYCLACHGAAGNGRGPAAPFTTTPPRDLTTGEFAWRTTPLGQPPTDDDLRTTVRFGAPGTSMHGFALADRDLELVIDVIKAFAPATFAKRATPLALPPPLAVGNPATGSALWTAKGCASCHGADGRGNTAARPYDLTTEPLRRPRADGDPRRAAALAIATGRAAMPGYADSLTASELWALADHVVALAGTATIRRGAPPMTPAAIELDRTTTKLVGGAWPGDDAMEARIFGTQPVVAQGPVPPTLAPAQASLSADQCARCHAKQHREWRGSIHRDATSPGFVAQTLGLDASEARTCMRCHAPLAEQITDSTLRDQGLQCAGCHVRGWTRHGPPSTNPSLLAAASYPRQPLELYERGDFCLGCHQLPPRTAVNGRPLLDTYREWLEGPYMARGIQCQHCHMPNREHSFLGIHDADTFRQAITLEITARHDTPHIAVQARLTNVGAGHYLPTTTTPAAWLELALVDGRGRAISGAALRVRIGRDVYYDNGWHEREDTRIPPGESLVISRAWSDARGQASHLRAAVVVSPDDYYERLYERRLAGSLTTERRALYQRALARARANHYTAVERTIPIAAR